jgi:hypothetical protein
MDLHALFTPAWLTGGCDVSSVVMFSSWLTLETPTGLLTIPAGLISSTATLTPCNDPTLSLHDLRGLQLKVGLALEYKRTTAPGTEVVPLGDGPVWVPPTGPGLEGQILLIIPSGQSK